MMQKGSRSPSKNRQTNKGRRTTKYIITQLINENKKLSFTVEKKIDKLKQRKFIAVEKFRVLSYFLYIY